jgi:hypothetical protein
LSRSCTTFSGGRAFTYLKDVFKARLAGQATTVVVSKCRVDWNLPGVRPLGPDIAVFADVVRHFTLHRVAISRPALCGLTGRSPG